MFKSKYNHPKNFDSLVDSLKFNADKNYIEFLRKHNVVSINGEKCVKLRGEQLEIETFFGFSEKDNEDLIKVNDFYEHRIPDDCLAIVSVYDGNLLCLTKKGDVRYWNHEINDLYFNEDGSGYKKQNIKLSIISKSFDSFLDSVEKCADSTEKYNPEKDPYNDSGIPFPDSSLNVYFKYPALFFKNNEYRTPIYMKKLELSERGRELLEKFKEMKLL